MSDLEPQVPEPMPETTPEPEPAPEDPAPAADPEPAPDTPEAPASPDPRDQQIQSLEQQNLALRSQVADLLAQIAAPQQNPSDLPPSPTGDAPSAAAPVPFVQSGFDLAARTDELLRQGVPANDAAEQARYEKKLYDDRQTGGVQPA